ncbi:phospholipid/cholesterol/gamma-HCH transport system substrate-binding protein [Nocardia transvalensis]|uniref:Phospholipid/cholesterol/gamma-HCH transport system substrate-binding protein n=1 Tax=Nocardia transvalensis TaxID=37333 RepID=A0A7W9PG77_9NOCA|nr:MlaD family protein [Nocardia transvalensis]MBB5915014.1 phospholipid/cholesterol/gamma-HCH transport system substrate-binding protein [Nocardia transvalensis]
MVDETTTHRREIRYGIIGVVFVAVLAVAAGVLYVVPFGKKTYTAELSEAQSVKAGDDIRVAGVPVGSVKSLELKPDRVVMRFTVDSDVFVGDQSSMDVRMLTIVGGNYVALFPAGGKPLGDKAIPMDRVRLPYSLVQTFQDAARPLREIDGDTLRRNLAALDTSLEQAPDALRTTLGTLSTYVDALNRQRTQVTNAVAVADEYVTMYDGAKTDLGRLMDSVNLMETLVLDKRAELREGVRLLRVVVDRVAGLAPTWDSALKPKLQQLVDAVPQLQNLGDQLEPVLASVQSLQEKLSALTDAGVTIDQSGQTVTAPANQPRLCVPLPGKDC